MSLGAEEFQLVSNLIKKRSGIFLSPDKSYLVDSRLLPVARKYSFNEVKDLINKIKISNDEKMIVEVVEAMTTNESSFFRDNKPFEQLKKTIIPMIISSKPEKKHFRIWSAACSTGQEPYSIAITILENPSFANYTFEIIATDIASHVLDKAKAASYSQFEVQRGLPITLLLKYATQDGDTWRLNDKVKSMVTFKQLNLIDEFSNMGKFDIIFCRNVLIYFEIETKTKVLNNLSKLMEPHSILGLGCTESIIGIENKFQVFQDIVGFYTLK